MKTTLSRITVLAGLLAAVLPLSLHNAHGGASAEKTAQASASPITIRADKPNVLEFPATQARFVRFFIYESSGAEPCVDELEVYGPDGKQNLALAATGSRATASSCLSGYAIHQIAHLNDGLYGNSHSWIAAGTTNEWAQVELPKPALVAKVVFSRDRDGRFSDRVPVVFEVQTSLDGKTWKTVGRHGVTTALPHDATWDDLLRYAFLCEQGTWSRIDRTDPVTRTLKQLEAMIDRFGARGIDVSAERGQLADLRRRFAGLATQPDRESESDVRLYLDARLAKRQLFLRDPDLAPIERVLFVKRHPYEPSHNYSDILDARYRPGGGIYLLDVPRRSGRFEPREAKLTRLFDAGGGVTRDPMPAFDASRVYFGYRASDKDPYHVMSIGADGRNLRQLTDGPFHDYYPCPLPDGGVAFVSTRCKARFLCWRPQAFVLFRMDADGQNIWPLSYANLSEWAPSVMRDGRIIWTRSEYLDKGADFGHTLWAVRPDGTHPELLFGNNTLNCYVNGREVPGTNELCCTLISHGGDLNGPIGLIDPSKGRFNSKAITNITPDVQPHYHMSWARKECFRDPVPIARDLFLVSHAPRDRFGLYVIDRWGNRELLYLDPAVGSMSPTPLRPTPAPPVLIASDSVAGAESAKPDAAASHSGNLPPETGQFIVQDVYRGLEPVVKRGSVKYLRVAQEVRADLVRLPSGEYQSDHPPFQDYYATPIHLVNGPHGWPGYVAKASLGWVPVEADGSVNFYAPAGKVLFFQLLDENLNEVQRMRSVVQLQPGERRGCVGCHEHRSTTAPAHAAIALTRPPRELERPSWSDGPFSYERVVQPVWDARCVSCHDAKDKGGINLTGTLDESRVPASYRTLVSKGLVHYFDMTWGREHWKADPLTFGTVRSKLCQVLDAGHHNVRLTRDETHRVKCWIDLNCPLWPDYRYRLDRPATRVQVTQTP